MSDPLSLAALTASALTQGIGFAYARAGAVLDRYRAGDGRAEILSPEEAVAIEGDLPPLRVVVEQCTPERLGRLEHAQLELSRYLEDPSLVTVGNVRLLTLLTEVRGDLEAVYSQRFRFRGEPSTSSHVDVHQELGIVEGTARAVRAKGVGPRANVRIAQKSDGVAPGGELTVLDIDGTIG